MAAGPLLLYGCLGAHGGREGSGTAVAPRDGHIAARAGRPGVVVAAPDDTPGSQTGEIAEAIARRSGFGLVVATGFVIDADAPRRVREMYARHVRQVAQGPLDFYVEVHGNTWPAAAARIEIATVGIERELALRLRTLAEMIRDAHLLAHPEAMRLDVIVAPADELFHPRWSALTGPRRALHIELPRAARVDFADVYIAILADFLTQAVSLPQGR